MNQDNALDDFANLQSSLIRGNFENSLKGVIQEVFTVSEALTSEKVNNNINVQNHCYFLRKNSKKTKFEYTRIAQIMVRNLCHYVIPRSEIDQVRDEMNKPNADISGYYDLLKKAKKKFIDYFPKSESDTKSGEGGELLLFLLAEEILGLPQAITKMKLKTSNNVHYHGLDGVHLGLNQDKSKLILYYGESKVYKSRSQAVSECLTSLKKMLLDEEDDEDLDLLTSYFDLGDNQSELIAKLKIFFNPLRFENNQLTETQALCLVAFDESSYDDKMSEEEVAKSIQNQLTSWFNHLKITVGNNNLATFHMNVFFVPLPCVKKFRNAFRDELNS